MLPYLITPRSSYSDWNNWKSRNQWNGATIVPTEGCSYSRGFHLHICGPDFRSENMIVTIEVVTYTYRLSTGQWPDLKAVYSIYHIITSGLPTWVEQSKDKICMVKFLFYHHHLFGHYHIFSFFIIHFWVTKNYPFPCNFRKKNFWVTKNIFFFFHVFWPLAIVWEKVVVWRPKL